MIDIQPTDNDAPFAREAAEKVYQEAREQRAFHDARIEESGMLSVRVTTGDFMTYNNALLEKLFTILDVAIPDEKRLRSMKKLVNDACWDNYGAVREWMNQNANGYSCAYPRFPFHQHEASVE